MRSALIALTLLLVGCPAPDETPAPLPELKAGAPRVGAAEGTLKLPVGTPLAGFTARCGCSGSFSKQDERDSAYSASFTESTGVHIRPTIKALWIDNGDEHLVMTKTDQIYSFDGFVDALTTRLEELTGEDLRGRVTHSTNHNHSSYGTVSQHTGLFLGGDKFNRENFERMVEQVAAVSLEAYEARKDAAIGVGWTKDWDPENRVYSDRRGVNNDLVVWEDMGPEQGGKDPHMQVLRVDDATDGSPIAIVMAWGMHPYVFGEDSPLATADATALVEAEVAEAFDTKVVTMFLQTGGGDASVRGSDQGWAKMETVGFYARDAVLDLWEATPTSSDPIKMETTSRAVSMAPSDVRVTRDGDVNWFYPAWKGEGQYQPDGEVYDENGDIISPLDEWYSEFGAAFCGSGDFDFPVGGLPTEHPIYTSCMNVGLLTALVKAFFRLTDEQVELPLDGMQQTYAAASRLGPLPVLYADGSTDVTDLLLGFFPGEPTSMYTEQWRRRVKAELGYDNAILFGYSMDHEGYLLIPEDWMRGGYEPDITFQGPLAAEYIMEQVLATSESILGTDVREGFDPAQGTYVYEDVPLPTEQPDTTPTAGTRLTNETLPEYYWVPDGFRVDLEIPAVMERIGGMVQLGWIGGDPGVDDPRVTLQIETDSGWEDVRTHSGRVVNEDHHDFGLGYTPDPLFPSDAEQTHYWWTVWQAVSHIKDRPGLPVGTYRLHVDGERYLGGDTTWPWTSEPYTLDSDAFEIVPATVVLAPELDGVWASLLAPSMGFRMIDIEGSSKGANPLRGELELTWSTPTGDVVETIEASEPDGGRTWIDITGQPTATELTVTDPYGNSGSVSFLPPAF